jgi:hypothetical protein
MVVKWIRYGERTANPAHPKENRFKTSWMRQQLDAKRLVASVTRNISAQMLSCNDNQCVERNKKRFQVAVQ